MNILIGREAYVVLKNLYSFRVSSSESEIQFLQEPLFISDMNGQLQALILNIFMALLMNSIY